MTAERLHPTYAALYEIIEKHGLCEAAEAELLDLMVRVDRAPAAGGGRQDSLAARVAAQDETISWLEAAAKVVRADRESDAYLQRASDEGHAREVAGLRTMLANASAEIAAARAESEKVADVADRVVARLTAGLIDQVCELRAGRDRLAARVADLERS